VISHTHQCIFVHIPKTAGNSVNRCFGVAWEDHKDLQRYFDEIPRELFDNYFKFAVVRNPWDRLFSDYNYQKKKSRAKESKLFVYTDRGRKRDFAEWVDTALADPGRYEPQSWGGDISPHIHRWSPQLDWIQVEGEPKVDFVAHLERLPEEFQIIRQRVGLPIKRLPHRNRRFHWHYSHYYDRTTREIVAAYYARDIEYFGYEFEDAFLHVSLSWPTARSLSGDRIDPVAARDEEETLAPRRSGTAPVAIEWCPPPHRPWFVRSPLAFAAGFALLLGLTGFSLLSNSLTAASALVSPMTLMPQTLRPMLAGTGHRAAVARTPTRSPFSTLSGFIGSLSAVHIELVPSPSGFIGFVLFDDDGPSSHPWQPPAQSNRHQPGFGAGGGLGRRAVRR
jgi:hypothetical protein